MNVSLLQNIGSNNANGSWTPQQGIRTSVTDYSNPAFPRTFVMDNTGIFLIKPGIEPVGVTLATLAASFIVVRPTMSYPPTFTVNAGTNWTVAYGTLYSQTVEVNSELSLTYQWQISTNQGNSWTNLTNAGVYSGVTTAAISISSVNGLGGNWYRVQATNALATITSTVAILTVLDPFVNTNPPNRSISATASTTFGVSAVGTATLLYQWQVSTNLGTVYTDVTNGATISSGSGVYSNATTATLGLATVATSANNYMYRCRITNGAAPTNFVYSVNALIPTVTGAVLQVS